MPKHDDVEEQRQNSKLSEDLRSLEDEPPVDSGTQRHDAAGNVIRFRRRPSNMPERPLLQVGRDDGWESG